MPENTARLSTALADRYKIERHLGEGGMANVYLAEDLKHKRKVAVKVLRPELSAVLGGDRFLNEIKVTANLQHPHILPLFDSGEADSFLYYVMPFIDGETLRDKLNHEKQLSIEETVEITKVIAGALDYAHKRGVIHRDIKPENILLQDGVALMADFGIAIAVKAAGGERLTETGLSLGTPAYMSPEQIAGQRDLDARSDVYSLACVTYEMLAGDPPFIASTAQAVMAKHVTDPAAPITTTRPSVSPSIANALAKALNKTPVDRYESAGAFAAGLTTEAEGQDRETKSIVVLPFANMSPDPDNEYFADGLTEEIIADLSRVKALRVISRNSTMKLKGTDWDMRRIAAELNCQYVLDGSVRRAGDKLRITTQLVEGESDLQLWADRYSGTVEDVFDMQETVARSIVDALELTITPGEQEHLAERLIDDVRAYECYLRAWPGVLANTEADVSGAIELLQRGLEIIEDNPRLLGALGIAYITYSYIRFDQSDDYIQKAEVCAAKIFAIDGDSIHGHRVLGQVMYKRGNARAVLPHVKKVLRVDPGDHVALILSGAVYSNTGSVQASEQLAEQFLEVDPLSPWTHWTLGWLRHVQGRFREAVEAFERAMQLEPGNPVFRIHCAHSMAAEGRGKDAFSVLEPVVCDAAPYFAPYAQFLGSAFRGDVAAATRAMTQDVRDWAMYDEMASVIVADAFAMIEAPSDALDALENAVDRGFFNYPYLAEHDPALEVMRGEPRMTQLLERVRQEWERFEA